MRELKVLVAIGFIFVMGFLGSARAAGPLTHVTTVPLGTKAHDIVLQGDFAYVVTDLGLTIVNVSNPASPVGGARSRPERRREWTSKGIMPMWRAKRRI